MLKNQLIHSMTGIENLLIHDLIAKLAHVRLKDTMNVIHALKAVSTEMQVGLNLLVDLPYSIERPNLEQAEQCKAKFAMMSR